MNVDRASLLFILPVFVLYVCWGGLLHNLNPIMIQRDVYTNSLFFELSVNKFSH